MKPNKIFAALTSVVLAAANSAFLTPLFSVSAEEETVSAEKSAKGCTVNVSVVDITTGKNLEGAVFELEENPTGSGVKFGRWNTSDEPVKTVDDLYSFEDYSINAVSIPEGYIVPQNTFFSFDKDGEVKDFTIRVVPENAERNVNIIACDWTDAVPTEDGKWFTGVKEYNDYITAEVYDEDGNRFTRETLGLRYFGMYLPDGRYRIRLTPSNRDYETINVYSDIANTAAEMYEDIEFPDKDGFFDIEVINGKLAEDIEIYVRIKPEVAEYTKDGCKANISVVDLLTNEPVEGVQLKFYSDRLSSKELMYEWSTTDEPVKNIKNLSVKWYEIDVENVPDGYYINKETTFNFSKLGDTQNIVIKAVPNNDAPNVNVTVYDWTDLVADPANETYEGYKLMEPDDYTLMVFDENQNYFDVTERNVHLPDGEYMAQVSFNESIYHHVDEQGWKARAVRRILGEDFIVPDGISTCFEIKDGKTVGQPCLFVEKNSSKKTSCTLDLKVLDGVTGEPADAANYMVFRIDEEFEKKAEENGSIEDISGLVIENGKMPKSGSVTVKELEPFVKYAVIADSSSKRYSGEKTVFITYDKDGDTKDITIRLMPYDYKKGDVNGDSELNVADLVAFQKWLLNASDSTLKKPANADFNEDGTADVFDLILLRKELVKNAD